MTNAPAQATSAALSFRKVSKSFSAVPALDEVNLDVPRAQLFGLVGANGAGKTTLLKCLLDFCRPDRGEISILGISNQQTSSSSDVAFLPERFNPPYYLNGRDFLRYMAELHRTTYDEEAVTRTFERLDLDVRALDRAARTYSKGMTQKLGLAACFLSGKTLQILDEPTSGLDPKARALLKQALRDLAVSHRTVFFTSHALADVEEICDRMAVLHAGHVRFTGTPAELLERYGSATLEKSFLACIDEPLTA